MRSVRSKVLVGTAAIAIIVVGCVDASSASAPMRQRATPLPDLPSLLTYQQEIDSGKALYVTVNGPNKVKTAQTVTYRAGVTGGSRPYYYHWVSSVCYDAGTCTDPVEFSSGESDSLVSVYIRPEWFSARFVAEVRTVAHPQQSGEAKHDLIGPLAYDTGAPGMSCATFIPNWYPFINEHYDPSTGGTVHDSV